MYYNNKHAWENKIDDDEPCLPKGHKNHYNPTIPAPKKNHGIPIEDIDDDGYCMDPPIPAYKQGIPLDDIDDDGYCMDQNSMPCQPKPKAQDDKYIMK